MTIVRARRSYRHRVRRLVAGATVAVAAIGVAMAPGAAGATDQQQAIADAVVAAGAPTPVVGERFLINGDSYSRIPTGNGPRQDAMLPAFAYGLLHPNVAPPGANDWSCKPKAGQNPVVLIHGTWESSYNNWAMLSPALKDAGYCIYAVNYGITPVQNGGGVGTILPDANATGDITKSGPQIAAFVDKVLASTGAAKVNMVGHSQGGVSARQYIRYDGGKDKVANLVTLGATNNGTTVLGFGYLARAINDLGLDVLGPAALLIGIGGVQQIVGSTFLENLNKDGEYAIGDVRYTIVGSRYDEVTTPYDSTFFPHGTRNTRNILLQNGCEQDISDHVALAYSPRAVSIVLNAFDPRSPLVCAFNPWLVG
ncbi:alpha/beta fold hydrolase [Gordonia sp. VNQ95]|uniref:esterase/lipase family protein n=1 Tax=Gordonia sp. VNQ95 TaxID=3156619 RepID=UPI0032B3EFE3